METTPQFLGTGSFNLPSGTTVLEFRDWPDRIGINNLVFNDPPRAVPEPGTWLLFGVGVAGLAGVGCYLRRGRRSADAV